MVELVAPAENLEKLRNLVCPRVESGFIFAVANAYQNWYDVPDREVVDILENYRNQQDSNSMSS